MSRDRELEAEVLEDPSQLRAWIAQGAKGDAVLGVGTEHEKIGFADLDASPIPYGGERGIERLLTLLSERYGWTRLYDGGHLLALERDGGAITLEPGGQLELSGAVFPTVHGVAAELDRHLDEVRALGEELGHVWFVGGLNPWRDADEVPWMPKPRYDIMRAYLPQRGPLAVWMMKMTASIQANYDFRDEADAMEMLRVSGRITPLITALFANSPVRLGRETGMASSRMAVWHETDPDRCGTPAFAVEEGTSFDDYVQYMLDVPMFFIKRDGRYVDMAGSSFRTFLSSGYEGHRPTIGDWELHLSTAFPDTRLKRYVEVRSADGGDRAHILAFSALWKAVFYDRAVRELALGLVEVRGQAELDAFAEVARRDGLDGSWKGRGLRGLAGELVAAARAGLDRLAVDEPSEAPYLDCLLDGARGDGAVRAPGERFLEAWRAAGGDPRTLIPAFRY